MGTHSVAEARNNLSELIDRALKGEGVVITRHGRPVVELKPVTREERPVTRESIQWLRDRLAAAGRIAPEDAGTTVSRMRDEDWR